MNKSYFSFILIFFLFFFENIYAQTTAIPDANFEQALIDLGIDKDGVVNGSVATADITEISILNVENKDVSDLTGIDDFYSLSELYCNNNQIISLDVSKNTNLIKLFCKNNPLTSLNIKNGNNTKMIDTGGGYNEFIISFDARENESLQCIQVDNESDANRRWGYWLKDTWAAYSTDCSQIQFTYVPDDNFEQALVDLNYDRVLDDYIPTTVISQIKHINLYNENISNLTGIQDFSSLVTLDCSRNLLTNLDMSNNILLTELNCRNNQLTSLEVSKNTILTKLKCHHNQLTNLNVSNNTVLEWLDCYNNNIKSIDVSNNTVLYWFQCDNNQLTDIDLSNNVKLDILGVSGNQLTSLNVQNGNNSKITYFYSTGNPNLTCIQVDNETAANTGQSPYDVWNKDTTATYSEDCQSYLGVDDEILTGGLSLYPNPVSNYLNIDSKLPITKVGFYSIMGQRVKEVDTNFNSIPTHDLTSGIYLLRIESENGVTVKKLIKQ